MSKRIAMAVVACCTLALGLALAGCASVDKSAYTGTWELESGTDETLSADSLALMKSLGWTVTITLNEDGTGAFSLPEETMDLTWEATSNSEGTVNLNQKTVAMKLSDGKLTIEDSTGSMLVFSKAERAVASASAASAASGESAAASDAAASASAETASASAEGSSKAASTDASSTETSTSNAAASAGAASAATEQADASSAEAAEVEETAESSTAAAA